MKKLITLTALCFGLTVANAQTAKPAAKPATATAKPATAATAQKPAASAQKPAATTTTAPAADQGYKFDKTDHDYGKIQKGSDPYCEFQLTNTGKTPLVIQEAHGSCGCTVPEYPKEPIAPGKTVTVKVRYDTNRVGPFEKQVTMTFQGKDQPAVLHIHGTVEAPVSEQPFPAPGNGTGATGAPVNN
jgi:hypothetical protein